MSHEFLVKLPNLPKKLVEKLQEYGKNLLGAPKDPPA